MIIFDLDNCIAGDEWRIPFIKWDEEDKFKRYHSYHQLSPWDFYRNSFKVNQAVEDLHCDIAIFTARPEHYRAMTEHWLQVNKIPFKHLFMRPENCELHSLQLKRDMLLRLTHEFYVSKEDIRAAYDDRFDVIEMYKSFGIDAHVLKIHNLCAYTQPKGTL